MSPLYLRQGPVLFHGGSHVALPRFYSSPEQTSQTVALEFNFCVIMLPEGHHRDFILTWIGTGEGRGWLQSAGSPLDPRTLEH